MWSAFQFPDPFPLSRATYSTCSARCKSQRRRGSRCFRSSISWYPPSTGLPAAQTSTIQPGLLTTQRSLNYLNCLCYMKGEGHFLYWRHLYSISDNKILIKCMNTGEILRRSLIWWVPVVPLPLSTSTCPGPGPSMHETRHGKGKRLALVYFTLGYSSSLWLFFANLEQTWTTLNIFCCI